MKNRSAMANNGNLEMLLEQYEIGVENVIFWIQWDTEGIGNGDG